MVTVCTYTNLGARGNVKTNLMLADFGLIFKYNKLEELKRNKDKS